MVNFTMFHVKHFKEVKVNLQLRSLIYNLDKLSYTIVENVVTEILEQASKTKKSQLVCDNIKRVCDNILVVSKYLEDTSCIQDK
jgi:hypothetical protein